MSDENPTPEQTWREVGSQFRALGESLAQAFRTTWQSEENRQYLQELRGGLEGLADSVGRVVQEASRSPEAQRAEDELRKAAQSAQAAGRQAWQDAEPHLLSALQQANAELQKIIDRMEQRRVHEETPQSTDNTI